MTTPDKLFKLDDIETKTVAPNTNFQVLAEAADQSIANRSTNKGLAAFGDAFSGFVKFQQEEQNIDDIKLAKDAVIKGDVMPDVGRAGQEAYKDLVNYNTYSKAMSQVRIWALGDAVQKDILDNPDFVSADRTSVFKSQLDVFKAELFNSIGSDINSDIYKNATREFHKIEEDFYYKVYEQEETERAIEGIQSVHNNLKNITEMSERTGLPLIDALTETNLIDNNVNNLVVTGSIKERKEAELIVMQAVLSHPEVLADSDILPKLLARQFGPNKNYNYQALLSPLAKGKDAEEFQKMHKTYIAESKALHKDVADKQTAADLENKNQILSSVQENWIGAGKTSAEGVSAVMFASGHFSETESNKKQKAIQVWMDNNSKFQRGSRPYNEALAMVLGQEITTPTQIDELVLEAQLNPNVSKQLKAYLTEEGKQKVAFIAQYNSSIVDLSKNVLSLSKLKLKNIDILAFSGREPTTRELMAALDGSGLDPKQVELIVEQVQDLHNGMRTQAERMGIADSIADKADGSVPQENLTKFQNMMEQNIKKLVADIDAGLEEREGPPAETGVDLGAFSKTKAEFPKIVNLPNNIFDRSSKDFGKESSDDQSQPLNASFDHDSNITFKAAIIDALIHKASEGHEAIITKEVENSLFETYAKDTSSVVEAFISSTSALIKKAALPETTDEQELDIGEKKMGKGDAAETKEQPKEDILGNASQLSPTNREKMMASNPQARVAPVSLKTMHDNKMGLLGQLGTFLLRGVNAVVSGVTTQGSEAEGVPPKTAPTPAKDSEEDFTIEKYREDVNKTDPEDPRFTQEKYRETLKPLTSLKALSESTPSNLAKQKGKKEFGGMAGEIAKEVVNYTDKPQEKYKLAPERIKTILDLSGADQLKLGEKGVESVDNIDRKVLSFSKDLFDDSNLKDLWVAYDKNKDQYSKKQINDIVRMDGKAKGAHTAGSAVDISASWKFSDKSNDYKTKRNPANRKVLNRLRDSLTNKGWTVIKKDGKEIVEVQRDGAGKNQYWMKFSKGKEIRYIEVVSEPRHIHLHTGEGFAGGWK